MKKFIGKCIELGIQTTIKLFGKTYEPHEIPFLYGPIGNEKIGEDFYKRWCEAKNHTYEEGISNNGLIPEFEILRSPTFNPDEVHPAIRNFYEQTSSYEFDIWAKWNPILKLGASILVHAVSHHIQQLNFPLNAMDARYGMSNDIITIYDKQNNIPFRCWLRKQMPSNEIIYCGFYIPFKIPSIDSFGIKTVFPLPKGAAVVLLEPINLPQGGFKLDSRGHKIGGSGYYRIHQLKNGNFKVLMAPIRESLDISIDEKGYVRVEHYFTLWGMRMLHLHFKIKRSEK